MRAELVSLTPNNAVLVGEVQAELAQERLRDILEGTTLDPGRVQVKTRRRARGARERFLRNKKKKEKIKNGCLLYILDLVLPQNASTKSSRGLFQQDNY